MIKFILSIKGVEIKIYKLNNITYYLDETKNIKIF